MKKNIVIIGCGNIGFRHLQGVLTYVCTGNRLNYQIFCIDCNSEALNKCVLEAEHREVKLLVYTKISSLPHIVDLAIIATSSSIRRVVFDELVNCTTVKNIIFEKVLFQRIEDYIDVQNKVHALNIHSWVNCPRRGMEMYQTLKKFLKKENVYEIHVSGGNWGLCCNTIHQLDYISYLSEGYQELQIRDLCLDEFPVKAKRKGYMETYGTISGICGKCKYFTISCSHDERENIFEVIGQQHYIINETKNELMIISGDCIVLKQRFEQQYVSQLSGVFAKQILENDNCCLTAFDESVSIHRPFIEEMSKYFACHGYSQGICPIT